MTKISEEALNMIECSFLKNDFVLCDMYSINEDRTYAKLKPGYEGEPQRIKDSILEIVSRSFPEENPETIIEHIEREYKRTLKRGPKLKNFIRIHGKFDPGMIFPDGK